VVERGGEQQRTLAELGGDSAAGIGDFVGHLGTRGGLLSPNARFAGVIGN
jgi:hypothetical protein